ncbi:MAG: TetR/AcrR family transcriptional regulator [Bauldia sp.]|nr:TetR/AcrR family transcriptional regulator [Bauldia sp.]
MREWTENDPKAGLLARKQAAILAAARREFLEKGFGDATMAGIAASAGVSVATLYRHAHSKEELFEAVVALRRDPQEIAAGLARIAELPLPEALVFFGEGITGMMVSPEVLAMHRMVIAEAERFPHLGRAVFDAVIGHVTGTLSDFLAGRIGVERANAVAPAFIERVVGDRMVRALLGLPVDTSSGANAARIRSIVAELLPEAAMAPASSKSKG